MPGVHNPDAHFLAGHQDGRDVSTNQSEDILDPVGTQDLCHAFAAMPRAFCLSLWDVKKDEI